MVFGLLRKSPPPGPPPAEAAYAAVVAAARRPALYEAFGAPDTAPGRFELIVLHAALLTRRLRAEASGEARAFAQDVFDEMFRTLDANLRELGIGDVTVPKRIKAMARSFYDGAAAYDSALDARDDGRLARDLTRIVFAGAPAEPDGPAGLAAYAMSADVSLHAQPFDAIVSQGPVFPALEEVA